MTRFCGISENENIPLTGKRGPLQATIRHALFLCFQKQDEIDNRERLFHRQGDQFIPQAIKDTLPYFLGAVDEDHFLKQNELELARDELRQIKAETEQRSRERLRGTQRIRGLVQEGKRVGIIPEDFEPVDLDIAIRELRRASNIDVGAGRFVPDFGETINRLQDEQKNVRDLLSNTVEEIRAHRLFLSEQNSYLSEGAEQKSRLSSIGLYKSGGASGEFCPVCESELEVPTSSVASISAALKKLDGQLAAVELESPHLQQRVSDLERKKRELEETLIDLQGQIARVFADDARARAEHDMIVERARVVGRIGSYLESVVPAESSADYADRLALAESKVAALEAAVSMDDVGQRMDTFLNIISQKMSEYAKRLDLEHSGSALRLDAKKLTVVADTVDGPVPLNRMGSGENWIGYHVLTHLALHWWLRRRNRPVPGLLVFDQPSQAHYPAERDQDGKLDPLNDTDRLAVNALFELMYEACKEIGDDFQLVVLDHAHIEVDWFDAAIIEEWRSGKYLVPPDWQDGA